MIENIEGITASVPLTPTMPEQLWIEQWSRQLYLKATSGNLSGWGEILCTAGNDPRPYKQMMEVLFPAILKRDENDIPGIWDMMRKFTFSGGYGITTGAISGVDIALWDLVSREKGVPLYGKIGGEQNRISRYVSLSRYRNEDVSEAVRNLIDRGYSRIKLHQSPSETLNAVRTVRRDHGYGFELMADINCGLSPASAMDFAKDISRYELKWIEEPVWPPDDYESLREINRITPVAAGENFFSYHEFRRVLDADALTYYQPDITKVGGITATIPIVNIIREKGGMVAFHNRPHNGWVGIAATAHLASATAPGALLETPPNEVPEEYFSDGNKCTLDYFLPSGQGHGITPSEPLPELRGGSLLKFHD